MLESFAQTNIQNIEDLRLCSALPLALSPNQLQSKLELPVGSSRAADCVEGTNLTQQNWTRGAARGVVVRVGILIGIRHGENRMIQNVEGFEPELQLHTFGDGRS